MKQAGRKAALILGLAGWPGAALAATGPAEMPPAGYAADAYVDSAGCLFRRAEVNGQAVWATQLDANGAPRCGGAPSVAGAPEAPPPAGPESATGAAGPLPAVAPAVGEPDRKVRAGAPPRRPGPSYAGTGYVQVGAFRSGENADRAVARLLALAFPAARAQDRIGSLPVTVVLAGPFADASAQAVALAQLRAAGFADAYLP